MSMTIREEVQQLLTAFGKTTGDAINTVRNELLGRISAIEVEVQALKEAHNAECTSIYERTNSIVDSINTLKSHIDSINVEPVAPFVMPDIVIGDGDKDLVAESLVIQNNVATVSGGPLTPSETPQAKPKSTTPVIKKPVGAKHVCNYETWEYVTKEILKGLTQKEIADKSGIPPSTVSKYKNMADEKVQVLPRLGYAFTPNDPQQTAQSLPQEQTKTPQEVHIPTTAPSQTGVSPTNLFPEDML